MFCRCRLHVHAPQFLIDLVHLIKKSYHGLISETVNAIHSSRDS
jgi:hypothetical protein